MKDVGTANQVFYSMDNLVEDMKDWVEVLQAQREELESRRNMDPENQASGLLLYDRTIGRLKKHYMEIIGLKVHLMGDNQLMVNEDFTGIEKRGRKFGSKSYGGEGRRGVKRSA